MDDVPNVPLSLLEWRELNLAMFPSAAPWLLLKSWFEEHGLILFDRVGHEWARAPGVVPRAPELGVYVVTGQEPLIRTFYQHEVSPLTSQDNLIADI